MNMLWDPFLPLMRILDMYGVKIQLNSFDLGEDNYQNLFTSPTTSRLVMDLSESYQR